MKKNFLSHFQFGDPGKIAAEIEVLIVDPITGGPSNVAFEILKKVAEENGLPFSEWVMSNGCLNEEFWQAKLLPLFKGLGIKPELFDSQLEFTTRPHKTLVGLASDINAIYRWSEELCSDFGVIPVFSGLPPVLIEEIGVFPTERYKHILQTAEMLTFGLSNGLHFHYSPKDFSEAIFILNLARLFFPCFIALAANSAVVDGRQSTLNMASHRFVQHGVFVRDIIPPFIESPDHFFQIVKAKGKNFLKDPRLIWWGARFNPLSGKQMTVELRIFDGQDSPVEVTELAAVWQAFIAWAVDLHNCGKKAEKKDSYEIFMESLYFAYNGLGHSVVRKRVLNWLEDLADYFKDSEIANRIFQRVEKGESPALFQKNRWRASDGDVRRFLEFYRERI